MSYRPAMPPRETLVVTWPLESVRPFGGSMATPGTAANSTRAPATAAPLSSLTWTTIGCCNGVPVWAICLPPLDSTMAAPNVVGLGSGADSLLREHDVAELTTSSKEIAIRKRRVISLQPPGELRPFER